MCVSGFLLLCCRVINMEGSTAASPSLPTYHLCAGGACVGKTITWLCLVKWGVRVPHPHYIQSLLLLWLLLLQLSLP
uniref:Secreted protein n=1 Tax=Physcomitrium patens TaxID=3218 RepID=A0A2K1KGK6_PHYPA|nr:hypothetical protein PHYPA_009286 [Physcomitrium patens]